MTLAKICGIRELEHGVVAAEAGADLIGFVFVPVRREVSPDVASEIIKGVRSSGDAPASVGLFVNETADHINQVIAKTGIDLVQLSGNETSELAKGIDAPVIKAVRIEPGMTLEHVRRMIESYLEHCVAVLIDSHVAGQWGGTGVIGDWDAAALLAEEYPVVLAGGLNAENVAGAIAQVNPAVVDVSSGVETDGRKDSQRIRAFLANATSSYREPSVASRTFVTLIEQIRHAETVNEVR
jgi:phosphoribosylanthranilate isomerase